VSARCLKWLANARIPFDDLSAAEGTRREVRTLVESV
jgi:hypothetical protein